MEDNDKILRVSLDYFKGLTHDVRVTPERHVEAIGNRIRSIRKQKGLSLHQLSNLTGFDVKRLSNIENGTLQPQLGTVMRLAKALDSAFGRLVGGVADKPYSITRHNEQKTISRSVSPERKKPIYTYKSLAPEVEGRHMEALLVQLEENQEKEDTQ